MLFSATMPGAVIGLARRYMSQPTHISATSPDDAGATVANTTQRVYRAHSMDKPEMVARILQAEGRGLAMIFCRTKRTAADIADQLAQRGFASGAVHGDLGQGRVSRRCARSATARWTFSSAPTSPPAVSTSRA